MIRALKITGVALGALLLLLILLLCWVIWTESGTRFALARAQGFLPAGINLGEPAGRLADRVVFTDVDVAMDTLELTIARLWLQWSPGELLGGHLEIGELGAEGVRYRALPATEPEPPGEPFSLPERVELPVSVAVHRLIVDDMRLQTAPDAEPIEVNVITATEATFADSRLALERLEVDSPMLSARGRLSATAAGGYPVDVLLDWRLVLADYAPLEGTTGLGGTLSALEVDQRLAAPYSTTLTGTVSHLVAANQPITLDLSLDTGEVALAQVQEQLPQATVSADARLSGPVEDLDVQAELGGTDPEGRRFLANLAANVAGDAITVEELTVRQPNREGELNGQGRIALAGNTTADLTIRWQSLSWPLTGDPTLRSPRGTLNVDGPLDDYRLSLDARLEPTGAPPVELELTGTGSTADAAVSLDARVGTGTVRGRMAAAWDPAVEGDVELSMSGFDPSVLAAQWPGSVDLTLNAAAQTRDDRLHVTVSQLEAGGRLRNQALSATARGRFAQAEPWPTVVIEHLDAALGNTRLSANGRITDRADLTWELASNDLSTLLPEVGGSLSGSGAVTGALPRVDVQADLQGNELAYAENRLGNLDLDADVDLSGESPSRLTLTAGDATVGGTAVSTLSLQGSGTPASHRASLEVDAAAGRVVLDLSGRLEDPWGQQPTWHYQLAEGELALQDLAPWRLERSAGGTVAAERLDVGEQCWLSEDARLCLQAARNPEGLSGSVDLENLRFAYFEPFFPEGLQATGAVNGSARVSQPEGGVLTADADFETTAGELTLPAAEATSGASGDAPQSVTLSLSPSRITADLDESQARAQVDLNLEQATLQVQAATSAAVVAGTGGTTTERPVADQTLTGSVQLEVPELKFLSALAPGLENVRGSVTGDLDLEGTLGAPSVTGALMLADGQVEVPQAGITLADLSVTLEGRGREVALQASAASGGGTVRMDGSLSLPGEAPTAELNIIGREFQVLDNNDAIVFVSPDLVVEAGAERISITGALHVPEAEITPGAQAPSAVTVSEDQVLVSEQPEDGETVAERELSAEVRLTLGDEVSFDGFGLTAGFEGDVLINQEPEVPTTATGELRIVDGEYRAYGQGLVIDSGRIYFAGGPVTQPALDIRAVRRPQEGILVGAQVGGTLEEPSFELFSEPAMTQQQQLSWLVLGRSLEETPEGQESALSRAALALGVKGGDFLARNIGQQVGLDQIGIETGSGEAGAESDPTQASLVVGKYLSPKLYVSYGIGLFNPESVLEMQYEISRRWKLVTQSSGESTGADVQYTVELGGQ